MMMKVKKIFLFSKFIVFYSGLGHLTFDKILYLFMVLYVSSIDLEETCDLFFIKREFQKFLNDVKEYQGKVKEFFNFFLLSFI